MKIDFYYWGAQCPINHETVNLLNRFKSNFDITFHDIDKKEELAHKKNMFFPFLTVVDDTWRFFSPLTHEFLTQLSQGVIIREKPYILPLGREKYMGDIVPLTKENMSLAGKCTGRECPAGCTVKAQFISKYLEGIYGYLNIKDGNLLGGAEFFPSRLVPYAIPKDDKFAFLTCLYLSSRDFDYKALPLKALEDHLKKDYDRVYAVSDELGVFPNGNLEWFLEQGYVDEGILSVEPGYCTLHLVCKSLHKA